MQYKYNLQILGKCKNRAYITSHWSQLPDDMIYALCTTNYRHSFTKNQVKEDVLVITHEMIFKISRFKIIYFFMYFNSV